MDSKQLRDLLKEELEPIVQTQREHTEKIDAITAELHQVHKLAGATLDTVKARYEKNKREIDEIKDRLDLPKEPYFGKHP